MPGKAAGSPAYWRDAGDGERSQCVLRGPRGNVDQRGAFPWGAHQGDRANPKRRRDTGPGVSAGQVLARSKKTGQGSVSRRQAVLVLMVAVEAKPVVKTDRDLIRRVYLEIDRTGAVVGGPFGEATHDM